MHEKSIAILGASGSIGASMLHRLAAREDVRQIHATYHQRPAGDDRAAGPDGMAIVGGDTDIQWRSVDASDESSIKAWVSGLGSVDWLINCAGMLHNQRGGPEKTIRAFCPEHFRQSMEVNCLPTLLLGKYALAALENSPAGVFASVSARVGSISDNRLGGWYSYRSSKAALNMSLKCLAIEWQRTARNIRVVALHPGTTDSRLSKPFQKNVPEGKLFTPDKTARLLIQQIERLHEQPSGRFIAYDGEEIPW